MTIIASQGNANTVASWLTILADHFHMINIVFSTFLTAMYSQYIVYPHRPSYTDHCHRHIRTCMHEFVYVLLYLSVCPVACITSHGYIWYLVVPKHLGFQGCWLAAMFGHLGTIRVSPLRSADVVTRRGLQSLALSLREWRRGAAAHCAVKTGAVGPGTVHGC